MSIDDHEQLVDWSGQFTGNILNFSHKHIEPGLILLYK